MFTKYGYDNLIILLVIALAFVVSGYFISKPFISIPLYVIGGLLACLTLWFFRDPARIVPTEALQNHSVVVSPADGKVVQIAVVHEKEYLGDGATQISIFLSPIDVHVNRIPVSGIIKYARYYPGEYLVAWHPKSSELNERSVFGLENEFGKILFRQITGFLARRIVFELKEGDTVEAGAKFGMMKFGSRMDVVVQPGTEILVREGDIVKGGESIICRLKKHE